MQGMPIFWFLQVREESPFASESLHGLGLAAGLLQSHSFPVQKIPQWRWLHGVNLCALCYLEISSSLSSARFCAGL